VDCLAYKTYNCGHDGPKGQPDFLAVGLQITNDSVICVDSIAAIMADLFDVVDVGVHNLLLIHVDGLIWRELLRVYRRGLKIVVGQEL